MREWQPVSRATEGVQFGVGQKSTQVCHDGNRNEWAAARVQQQGRTRDFPQSQRQVRSDQHTECIEDRITLPLFLLCGEPRRTVGRERAVMETIAHEGIGPGLRAAFIEAATPRLDTLDRGAEPGTVSAKGMDFVSLLFDGSLAWLPMVTLLRRTAIAGLAMSPLMSSRAQTPDFPDRPLRFVVGFPPGGPNDLLARLIAPGIGERLGRTVVIDNKAGSNGEIATAAVAKAASDGSSFLMASNGSTTIAPALGRTLPYDIRIDFAAVAPVGINPMLLVVRPDLPAGNVAELLTLARARPGKLNGASAGAAGPTHLALELFKAMGKLDIVHVPYKGGGPAMTDLMAGQVDLYFGGLATALPHVLAGKLRALGQTGEKRSAAAPDIPTIAESGLPGYEAAISYGVFLPAATPEVLVARLQAAIDATIRSPDILQKFTELGADPQFGSPTEFARTVADDLAKWTRLARDIGLKAE